MCVCLYACTILSFCLFLIGRLGFCQEFLEFTRFVQLRNNVVSANEFSVNVQLRSVKRKGEKGKNINWKHVRTRIFQLYSPIHYVVMCVVLCCCCCCCCYCCCLHGGPRGKLLDTLSDGRIIQNIDTAEIDSLCLKCLYNLGRESTHGHGRISLHVEHDRIVVDVLLNHFDGLVNLRWDILFLGSKIVVAVRKVSFLGKGSTSTSSTSSSTECL